MDYTLTDVKYDVKAKQIANITKTNTVLVTDAAPVFEESIVENGITYRLKSVTTAEGDMGSRSVTYTKVYTYNGLTKTDDIPAVVAGSVRDEATNEVSTINMTQTGLVKKNEQKSDDFVFQLMWLVELILCIRITLLNIMPRILTLCSIRTVFLRI